MKNLITLFLLTPLLLVASCRTQTAPEPKITPWTGAQVFKMCGGFFMSETVELKDGHYRY